MTESIGSLVIDLLGIGVTEEERDLLAHPLVGGVILFARNYESREQLTELCHQIRTSCKKPLLIMVDQEGGRVQRFQKDFTQLPALATFGKIIEINPIMALELAKDCAWLMATELVTCSIDLSLAPVLDLNKGVSTVIGNRAFHHAPQTVATLARSFISGMHEAGMAATGKHFPGHGSVRFDSHETKGYDHRSFDDVANTDMLPFLLLKHTIQAMMMAHIIFKQIDEAPVGYSKYWLQEILRKKLQFEGVIFSDDLSMEGGNISSSHLDRMVAAREAGCDFTMICNHRKAVIQVLDHLPYEAHVIEADKWMKLARAPVTDPLDYTKHPRWRSTSEVLKKINGQNDASWEEWLASL